MCLILIALVSYTNAGGYPEEWFVSYFISLDSQMQNVGYKLNFDSLSINFLVRDLIFNSVPFESNDNQEANFKHIFYSNIKQIDFVSWRGFVNVHIHSNNVQPIICYGLEIEQELLGKIIFAFNKKKKKAQIIVSK
jgi:hypothetical protein